MNINIISVGKVREKYIKQGIDEFLKRIAPYSSIKVTEIPAEEMKSDIPAEKILEKEAEKILNNVKENTYIIVLDKEGKNFSSEKFAQKLKEISLQGVNQVAFIVGSSEGLSDKIKLKAHFLLSFSEMTFPHQLMRLILVEQVYRAFKILKNEPYHK